MSPVSLVRAAAMAVGVCGLAVAQHAEGPSPVLQGDAWPDSVELAADRPTPPAGPADAPVVLTMPPLDSIPPMPMPSKASTPASTAKAGVVVVYNADTGTLRELPAVVRAEGGEASGGASFTGMGGDVGAGLDNKWGGTLGIIGGLGGYPQSANCKLAMRFVDIAGAERWFVCSGTMNDSGVVLTAAHCIYARDCDGTCNIFDFAQEVFVFPGWDGVGQPLLTANEAAFVYENFGAARAADFTVPGAWIDSGDTNFDVAVASITRDGPNGRSVGMLTGWYSWNYGANCPFITGTTWYNLSYPAQACGSPGLHNGRDMYYWFGTPDDCPGNMIQLDTTPGCFGSSWGGMSGSSLYWVDGSELRAGAVASTSDRFSQANYARLWEGFVLDILNPAEQNQRTGVFDIEPLRFRYSDGSRSASVLAGGTFPATQVQAINATNADPGSRQYVVDVYLSSNNNISVTDRLLASWFYTVDLAAMSNATFGMPAFVLPGDLAPGSYWVGAIVRTVAGELTSTNNDTDTWDAVEVTVNAGPGPGQAILVSPADGSINNSEFSDLDWSRPASGQTVYGYDVYFGTDPTPDAGEYNTTTTFATARSLPTLALGTTYYWRIDTNGDDGITTGRVWSFTVRPARFDFLAIEVAPTPGSYAWLDTLSVDFTVTNTGELPTPSWSLNLRASADTEIDLLDADLGTYLLPPLAPGETLDGGGTTLVPTLIPGGEYYVGLIAIADEPETITTNNAVSSLGTITITQTSCPADINGDLSVDLFDILDFFQLFGSSDPAADIDQSGDWNLFDIIGFFELFGQPC